MSDETKDELTLEERQLVFDELMRKKIESEQAQEQVEILTEDDLKDAPAYVKLALSIMATSSHEAREVMRQVDMMSGNNTGMMIRNSFEMILQQQLFVKNLLLHIAQQEGIFEEQENVPSQSPDRRDPRFRQFNIVNPSNGLDQPEGLPSGGEGDSQGDDNRGGSW